MIERAPKTTDKFDAYSAEIYIYTCTHDNKYDWRMPTIRECADLIITGSWNASDFNHMTMSPHRWKVTPVRTNND
jgi:hypothetical protein